MPGMSTNVVDVSHGLSVASIASNRLNTPFDTLFNGCGTAPSSDGAVSSPPAERCAEPDRTKTATNAAAPRTDKATASLRGHLFLPLSSNIVLLLLSLFEMMSRFDIRALPLPNSFFCLQNPA